MTNHTIARHRAVGPLLGMCCLLLASSAAAQPRWGRPSAPRRGACFYRDANFEGDYFCAAAGEDIPSMPSGMNDQISSIRMFGGVEVGIFQDVRFRGRSTNFDHDVRNLTREGWNDRLSSIRIREGRDGGGDARGNGDSRRPEDPDKIVRRAYQDILNREPDQPGLRLYRSHIIDDRWSEAQVRDALRSSAEYRELTTMTPAKAEEVVRRAYRAVLNREPDPASRPFVDHVLREHWTQQQVEAELRKSAEYRNKRQ